VPRFDVSSEENEEEEEEEEVVEEVSSVNNIFSRRELEYGSHITSGIVESLTKQPTSRGATPTIDAPSLDVDVVATAKLRLLLLRHESSPSEMPNSDEAAA